MYRTQTTRSLILDCILILFMPALVIETFLVGTFALVARTEDMPVFPLPVGFMVLVGAVTLLISAASAVAHWVAGPGTVRMTPEEEAVKRAEIEADVAYRMAQARLVRDDAELYGPLKEAGHNRFGWIEDDVFENPFA